MEIDRTIHAARYHSFHDCGAEPTLLRRGHGRSVAFGPVHRERVAVSPPADIQTALAATRDRARRYESQ
jgi:hypothetical protein